jgi:hypothetical protein
MVLLLLVEKRATDSVRHAERKINFATGRCRLLRLQELDRKNVFRQTTKGPTESMSHLTARHIKR